MIVRKAIQIPVHYATTQSKLHMLDKLTARITYGIRVISECVSEDTRLDRTNIRKATRSSGVAKITGLSSGFIQQCEDKVLWSWKSYQALYSDWEKKLTYHQERLLSIDDNKKGRKEQYVQKLIKKEPSPPTFHDKTPCRIDTRTGKIQKSSVKLTSYWMHISSLIKCVTIDIPLNPSYYHIKHLEDWSVSDFEVIKRKDKYYAHVSLHKEVVEKPTCSIGGIDQGLNRSIATVLLKPVPCEELIKNSKEALIEKYDDLIAELQQSKNYRKLRQLRSKRADVSLNHDRHLATQVAEFTKGCYIAIGNTRFGQTQYHGNGMKKMRKRIGKWSYSRQRTLIVLKRAELGYPTMQVDERYTSKTCYCCGSRWTVRKWVYSTSYILCHSCGAKIDADINAAYNIALRCRGDWLKAQMNFPEKEASVQDGCPRLKSWE
jgi:putative transposase